MSEAEHDHAGDGLKAYCRGVAVTCARKFRNVAIYFELGSNPGGGSSVIVTLHGRNGTESTYVRGVQELELYVASAEAVGVHDVDFLDKQVSASERAYAASADAAVRRV